MPASIVARVVRMPVLAAAAAMALAACSNDPMSPVAPRSQVSGINRSVARSDASAGVTATVATAGDISVPWYRNSSQATSTKASDISVPWYRSSAGSSATPAASVANTASDISVPWY